MSTLATRATQRDSSFSGGILGTNDNMFRILAALDASPDIAVDTETSGLRVSYGEDYLMGICVDVPGTSAYLPFRHPSDNLDKHWLEPLEKIFRKKHLFWHNLKFDFHSLWTIGINPLKFEGLQDDTLLIATLVDEELPSKELDFLYKWYFKDPHFKDPEVKAFMESMNLRKVPANAYEQYGSKDAWGTRKLRNYLWAKLVKQGLVDVYRDTEEPFAKLLFRLEQRGMYVDTDFASSMAERGRGRMATIYRELGGANPSSPTDLKRLLIEELELPVLAHTKSCEACASGSPVTEHEGKPSFNKAVMEDYDDILNSDTYGHNLTAQRVAEYRGWQKATTSLYEPLVEKTGNDHRIRTSFKQHGTVTGRLSATDPNLQQIPRGSSKAWNGRAKSCFTHRDPLREYRGWDYSQLELRLAASYGWEELLLTEFAKDKADPFEPLCYGIFGMFNEELRHDTKTFTYANLFGAGLAKIAAQLGRSRAATEPLYVNYQNSIPGIMRTSRRVNAAAKNRGYIKYWDGRRRHFKDPSDSYKAWNSLLQGGGAQMVKQAMLRCQQFEDSDCKMVLTVHDEITFDITRAGIADYEPQIVKAMTDFPIFGVRFAVEGKAWK